MFSIDGKYIKSDNESFINIPFIQSSSSKNAGITSTRDLKVKGKSKFKDDVDIIGLLSSNDFISDEADIDSLKVTSDAEINSLKVKNIEVTSNLITKDAKSNLNVNGYLLSTPITYSTNQDKAYLIAGAAFSSDDNTGWSGKSSNWGSHGFQHKIKSDYKGLARITIDDDFGEVFTVQNGGNTGIGIENPKAKLHVNGSSIIQCNPSYGGNPIGINTPSIIAKNMVFAFSDTNKNDSFYIRKGSKEKHTQMQTSNNSGSLQLQPYGGSVGIGLTNPSKKLDVYGSGRFNSLSSEPGNVILNTTSETGNASNANLTFADLGLTKWDINYQKSTGSLAINDKKNNKNAVTITPGDSVEPKVGINTNDPSETLDVKGNINFTGNLLKNGAIFLQDDDRAVFREENGKATYENNVGIGEINALSKLHVRGAGPQLFIEGKNNEDAVIKSGSGPSQRANYHEIRFGHNVNSANSKQNFIKFNVTNGTEVPKTRMIVNGDGNVGIGTTSPETALEISSSSGLRLTNTEAKVNVDDRIGYIDFNNAGYGAAIESCVNVGGASNNADLRFKTTLDYGNSYIERMRIDRSGNVGIGKTKPVDKLDVGSGNIRTEGNIYMGNWLQSLKGDINLMPKTSSNKVTVKQGHFHVGDSIKMHDVQITIDGGKSYDYFTGLASNTTVFQGHNNTQLRANNGSIAFYAGSTNNTSEKMRINSDGNVGIDKDLNVVGDIKSNAAVKANRIETEKITVGEVDGHITGVTPPGTIMMWSGELNSDGHPKKGNKVYKEWRICDGLEGTPNLKGRFILSSTYNTEHNLGNQHGGKINVNSGQTGGQKSVTLSKNNLPSHKHNVKVTVKNSTHDHTIKVTEQSTGNHKHNVTINNDQNQLQHTNAVGNHNHTITSTSTDAGKHSHGASNAGNHRHLLRTHAGNDLNWSVNLNGNGGPFTLGTDDSFGSHWQDHDNWYAGVHTHTIQEGGTHNHTINSSSQEAGGHTHKIQYSEDNKGNHKHNVNVQITDDGSHSHNTTVTEDPVGQANSINNMPQYYVLAYIMRIN